MPRPRHPTATIEAMQPMRRRLFTAPLMALAVVLASLLPATFAGGTTAPTLRLLTEPSAGIAPIDALFSGAKRSVDLVVYELADPHLEAILAGDAARGVKVRVLLDRDDEESHNAAAYAYLEAHHVPVRWASDPGIDLTHEKAAVIDNTTALVMTLNLVASDYATTRDFAVVDTDRAGRRRGRPRLHRRLGRGARRTGDRSRPRLEPWCRGRSRKRHRRGAPQLARRERGDGRPVHHRAPRGGGSSRCTRRDRDDRVVLLGLRLRAR